MTEDFRPSKWVIRWMYLGIAMVLAMVVIGGITRLTHSGLSMVHWSFTGSLPPLTEEAWQLEFQKYQQSPEFQEVHSHFQLAEFKSIFWWEYIHRMFGRLIGLVFLVPFAVFLFKKQIPRSFYGRFAIILGLGAFQALLGWFMVKSGLVDVPRVSHYRLAAHLSTAFLACAYIYWVLLEYSYLGSGKAFSQALRKPALILIGLIGVQIVFGAFVAGLRAGFVHNTWPLMDGEFMAEAALSLDPAWLNFIEGKSGVQFVHRTLALLILAFGGQLAFKFRQTPLFQKVMLPVVVVLTAQVVLGIVALLAHVPIWLGVLHQVVALILLLSVVRMLFYSRPTT